MMPCREFENILTDYMDGSLLSRAKCLCDLHALRCQACRDLLTAVRTTVLICRMSSPPTHSSSLEARILRRTASDISSRLKSKDSPHIANAGTAPSSAYTRRKPQSQTD